MKIASFFALILCFVCVSSGRAAEVAQRGTLRVSFSGALSPRSLPRNGSAPIAATISGKISTTDGSDPPPLQRMEIAINRNGRLDPEALPTCQLEQIQPATTENAMRACRSAKVGEGQFSAAVAIPGQAPFPSKGAVTAFNGAEKGRPVILLHIYGTEPIPTSLTVPLRILSGKGQFGTILRGALPSVKADVGFVTGISLRLRGAAGKDSRRYLTAGCPAPKGFPTAVFPFARGSFYFVGGKTLSSTLTRTCHAIK